MNDDKRGLGQALNETDANGNGIPVKAQYYLEVFNLKNRESKQRQVQAYVNNPLQYFYNFDLQQNSQADEKSPISNLDAFTQDLIKSGVKDNINLVLVPIAKNVISLRLENIADFYDDPTLKPQ